MKYLKKYKFIIYIIFSLILIILITNVCAKNIMTSKKSQKQIPLYKEKRNLNELKNKKLIAITFDDGPNGNKTKKLLKGLDKYNAKVTFFLIGNKIEGQEEIIREIYQKGHTIGSHTYNHKNLFTIKKEEDLLNEVNLTNQKIKKIINEDIRFLRPPYGNYNHKILQTINMSFILWNVDTKDWQYKNTNRIANYIEKNASDGDIILLHDMYKSSINGVLKAIKKLKKQGYEFVSLEEMEIIKNQPLLNHKAYYKIK